MVVHAFMQNTTPIILDYRGGKDALGRRHTMTAENASSVTPVDFSLPQMFIVLQRMISYWSIG